MTTMMVASCQRYCQSTSRWALLVLLLIIELCASEADSGNTVTSSNDHNVESTTAVIVEETVPIDEAVEEHSTQTFSHANERSDPDPNQFACFQDDGELQQAVDAYIDDDSSSTSNIAHRYGWPIGEWCVSTIENFDYMFSGKVSFNEDISSWDVSNGRTFVGMFQGAALFNQPLNSWDMSNAHNLENMFQDATSFDQPLNAWSLPSAQSMRFMFQRASSFNQDVSTWAFHSDVPLDHIFDQASSFDQDLCAWGAQLIISSDEAAFNRRMFVGTSCETTTDPLYMGNFISPLCSPCSASSEPAEELPESQQTNDEGGYDIKTSQEISIDIQVEDEDSDTEMAEQGSIGSEEGNHNMEQNLPDGVVEGAPNHDDQGIDEAYTAVHVHTIDATTKSEVQRLDPSINKSTDPSILSERPPSSSMVDHDDEDLSVELMEMVHFKSLLVMVFIMSGLALTVWVQKQKHAYSRGIDPSAHTLVEFETLAIEEG